MGKLKLVYVFIIVFFYYSCGKIDSQNLHLISDPNFPLIKLPNTFQSRRSTERIDLAKNQEYELIDAIGPGCIRHIWITTTIAEGIEIEIYYDGAKQPQIKMKMNEFFGVLLGKQFYRIESASIKLLPKNGYNSYFPIPFQSNCKIVLRNTSEKKAQMWSMVNWQKYKSNIKLTPFRFHAVFSEEKPAESLGTSLLGSITGRGFVAGLFHAISQQDKRDLIWHTGGDTWLIDGETNPYCIRGIGSEDVFGFSFGAHADMSQWTGVAEIEGSGPSTSEAVMYRFFGIDPVYFNSSLVLRFGTRGNDIESVLYYYLDSETEAPDTISPEEWILFGPDKLSLKDFGHFEKDEFPKEFQNGNNMDLEWSFGGRKLSELHVKSEHSWVDFGRWMRRDQGGNVGTYPNNCLSYARTVIRSTKEKKVTLRLGFDDWMKVWLNEKPIIILRHDNGFDVAEVPVTLKIGENHLVIKLSNFDNVEWRCWAFSCVIKE